MAKLAKKHVAIAGAALIAVTSAGIAQARDTPASTTPPSTTPVMGHGDHRFGGGPRDGGPFGAALAAKLGVSVDKLQAALMAIRVSAMKPDPDADRAHDAKALASALGVDQSTIQTVLDAQRPAGLAGTKPGETTPPNRPAPPTGSTPPNGTTPNDTTPGRGWGRGPGGPGGHDGGRGHGGPGFGGQGGFGGRGAGNAALVTALAKATGKSEGDVKAALTKLADARDADRQTREDALATALADKLGIDKSKVIAAFAAMRPAMPGSTTPPATTP